jgi:surface antigen
MRRAALIALLVSLAGAAPGAARTRLVTAGYPYAASCPRAGIEDRVDRWLMNTCNCTSYAAWALWRNGFRTDWFAPGRMDAWNWPNVARREGIAVGSTPRPGAIAVWPEWGRFGHLAFVAAVHPGGRFDVAEYNTPGHVRFGFDRRTDLPPRAEIVFVYVPRRSDPGR